MTFDSIYEPVPFRPRTYTKAFVKVNVRYDTFTVDLIGLQ